MFAKRFANAIYGKLFAFIETAEMELQLNELHSINLTVDSCNKEIQLDFVEHFSETTLSFSVFS